MSGAALERSTTWPSAGTTQTPWQNMRGRQGYGSVPPGSSLGGISPTSTIQRIQRVSGFDQAWKEAEEAAFEMSQDGEMAPLDRSIWNVAFDYLKTYSAILDAPLITPLQQGGVCAEWHEAGLNIELRFRGFHSVFTVVEDARNEIGPYMANDPYLDHATRALNLLSQRTL